jgi:integrase
VRSTPATPSLRWMRVHPESATGSGPAVLTMARIPALASVARTGGFMRLVEGLGWRASAICALRARDVDLTQSPTTPHRRGTGRPHSTSWPPARSTVIADRRETLFAEDARKSLNVLTCTHEIRVV